MFANALLLAFRQIWRNPMRSLLTVLGIVIGVAAVITMVTLGNGATTAVRQQIESFGSNQLMLRPGQRMGPGGSAGAPAFKLSDIDALTGQLAGVESAAPQLSRSTVVVANGRNWSTSAVGTSNAYFTIDNRKLAQGRLFEAAEETSGAAVCVVGRTVVRELFGDGNALGQMLRVKKFSCRIIGVLEEKGTGAMGGDQDDLVVLPFQTVARRLVGKDRVNMILIGMDPQSDREHLKTSIRQLMRERRSLSSGDEDNFSILDTAEVAEKVASTTKVMTGLLGAVAAVSLLVGGIGIMNIMLVSVAERTREIGIRKAIGARRAHILLQFLVEACVLSILGCLIGLVLSALGLAAFSAIAGMTVEIEWRAAVAAILFSAGIGVVFGSYPAAKASRMTPIDALQRR